MRKYVPGKIVSCCVLSVRCAVLLSLVGLTACQSSGAGSSARVSPGSGSFSLRQVSGDANQALAVAEQALIDNGFAIESRDYDRRSLLSWPLAGDPVADGRRSATSIGTRPEVRRVAEMYVDEASDGLKVFCRVVVQERVTEAYRMQRTDMRTADSPAATPIERGAGATREQRQVWRMLRRDKRRERAILEDFVLRLSGTTQG